MKNEGKCYADECERDAYSRGMCLMHYKRWQKYGDPNVRQRAPRGVGNEDRLRLKGWDVTAEGCWESRAWKTRKMGYALIHDGRRSIYAHRMAYEAWVGPIPDGLIVRHKCDNPPCINPEHLEVGTHADNMRDMMDRGRGGSHKIAGEKNPQAKLAASEVIDIRSRLRDGESYASIATEYRVSRTLVYRIDKGEAWRGVGD